LPPAKLIHHNNLGIWFCPQLEAEGCHLRYFLLVTTSCQYLVFYFLFAFFIICMSQNSVLQTLCHFHHHLGCCWISSKNVENVGTAESGQESFISHCLPAFRYKVEALSSFSELCFLFFSCSPFKQDFWYPLSGWKL